jgi:hypothetical protein
MVVFIKFSSVCSSVTSVVSLNQKKKNSEKAMRKFDSGPAAPRKPVTKTLVAALVAADRSGSAPSNNSAGP